MDLVRHWWRRYVDLFVAEVVRPDGSRYLASVDPTGLSDCWALIEIESREAGELDRAA